MATDAKLVLQAGTTKTTSFNSTGLDLPSGGPLAMPLWARVIYSAAANASGSNTFVFSVEESDDNATFFALSSGAAQVVTLSTTAQAAEIFVPFVTRKRYVRLVATLAGAGTSPTITYVGDLTLARP
ncbi:MAG: hypothetical protein M3R61_00145 [Chloroflexota bacterium]|nr:hypothetical protein [Chloroflexota bacterium]